ncbi:carboxypeptidase B-like [Hydractinia symbiolongicarpus]|uniref:carboxypeptidase B-like n=1 Tax=Hydractinia symbiolongicarpus TaxID=13093 RepID=UPI00254C6092|nr:carboxypeptidase B-like [Hydractinia symbiolongicarpus]
MKKLMLLLFVVVVSSNDFTGDQVLRMTPATEKQVIFLKEWIEKTSLQLDVWREPGVTGNEVDIHIKAFDLGTVKPMLKQNNIPFKVMMNDVGHAVEEERSSNRKNAFFSRFDYNRYNQYSEIKMEIGNLVRAHRNKASKFTVGRSYEGDIISGIKITDGNSVSSKPAIWIDGGIHAREWISTAVVMNFIKLLLTSNSREVSQALSKYDFYILPVFNVDGYKYTFTGSRARFWRKTRSKNGLCIGADPNRNWDHKWGGIGTSSNPCKDTYHGSYAFSEVEVQNVANYLRQISNLKAYWSVHAFSQLVLYPWSWTTKPTGDDSEIKRVADIFVNTVRQRYGTTYRAGQPSTILYPATGGSIDWVRAKLGVKYSYGLELRDTGKYGFLLPTQLIKPTSEETCDALLASINAMQ